MTAYKLTYYNIRGFAENIRLIFALAKCPYEDNRIDYIPISLDKWDYKPGMNEIPPEIKKKAIYGQVPILEFDGQVLAQSATIARFLARKFGFHGKNELESARVDEIVDGVRDFTDSCRSMWLAKTDEEKALAKKNFVEVTTPKFCTIFNEMLVKNLSGFLVGQSVTLADIVVFSMMGNIKDVYGLDVTKDYEGIALLIKKVESIPEIHEWLQKRPHTAY